MDHTTAQGGAEFALMRMLVADHGWAGTVLLPRTHRQDPGVYAGLVETRSAVVNFLGPAQSPGASKAGPVSVVWFGLRLVGQALAIRMSRQFRSTDVVHANTSRAALYAALASWGTRKALVVHLRDTVDRTSLGGIGFVLFTRIVLGRATGVIANSAPTLKSAMPFLKQNVLTSVVPSAAGIREDRSQVARVRGDVGAVGMVARIDPWKGQDLLIRAFARVYGGTDVRLIIAGEPAFGHESYAAELDRLVRELDIRPQVDLLGHVDDVNALLNDLDVCVQASRRPEPLGQNVLQYLAAGKVIVATREGGPGEWIADGENGVLFDMNNLDQLVDALTRVSADSGFRKRLAHNAVRTPGLKTDAEVAAEHLAFFSESFSAVDH